MILRFWKKFTPHWRARVQLHSYPSPVKLPTSQGMTWAQKITHVYNDKAGGVMVLEWDILKHCWARRVWGIEYNVSN